MSQPLRVVILKPSKYTASGSVERTFAGDSCPTAPSPTSAA